MSQLTADTIRLSGIPAIVVNNTYRLAPWAWMLYAADDEWWAHPSNHDARSFAGLRVSCQHAPGVHVLRNAGAEGYSPELDCVHTHGNSGAQALQIAVKTGAAKVLLFGFDMRGATHWHGDHAHGLRNTAPELYPRWIQRMRNAAPAIMANGCDVVNCTPGSALACYRTSRLEDELQATGHACPAL